MTLKSILAAVGVAALVATSVPVAAQAEGMHGNMKRQMMMSHARKHHRMYMHHHRMMEHHHRMMTHHHRQMM